MRLAIVGLSVLLRTYAPDYVKIDGDIVVTMTEDSGSTARFTGAVTHTAERTGDCK